MICAAVAVWNGIAGALCSANVYTVNDAAKRAVSAGKCTKLLLNAIVLPQQYACQR